MEVANNFWDIISQGKLIDVLDLMSQQEMAYWAKWLFWVSLGSTIIGVAGFIVLMVSLSQTSKATKAAIRSADLAHEATIISQRIGEAQTRAYLSITDAQVAIMPHTGVNYGNHPVFRLQVLNSGASPAIAFRWSARVVYFYANASGEILGSDGFPPDNWGQNVASQGTLSIESHHLPSYLKTDTQAYFDSNPLHLVVTIKTLYYDVFDREHSDSYNFMALVPSGAMNNWREMRKWPSNVEETSALVPIQGSPAQHSSGATESAAN